MGKMMARTGNSDSRHVKHMNSDLAKLTTIIFDFDGTLAALNVDFKAMRSGVLERIRSRGLPPEPFENLFALEMITEAREVLSVSDPSQAELFSNEAFDFIRGIEVTSAREGRVFEGVPDMLLALRKRQIATAVLTRNCRDAVKTMYPDIEGHVDMLMTRDDVDRVKPDPLHLLTVLEQLKADPRSTLMVGDHPMDISVGKAAGTLTAGVLTGSSSREALLAAGSDLVLERVTELTPTHTGNRPGKRKTAC